MAYEKTTWQSGDIVTSEKLNNIENGVANANNFVVLSLTIDESTGNIPLGKSYNDLMAYYNNNTLVYIKVEIPVSETQTENVMYVLDKLTYEQDFGYSASFSSNMSFFGDTADEELINN